MGISTSTVSAGDEVRDVACDESATLGMPTPRKNRGIFVKNSTVANLSRDFASVLADKIGKESWSMDVKTRRLIKTRLESFFFLEDSDFKLNIVMKVMKKRVTKAGDYIVREGEPGDKLYVITEGSAEVRIKDEFIRTLYSGAIFGELALLYDAPRSATVRCRECCTLWSLERDAFKYVQAFSASAQTTQRARWLSQSPELAKLNPLDLSRLVNTMPSVTFAPDSKVIEVGEFNDKVLLIEKGRASVYVPCEAPDFADDEECDEKLQIIRPRRRIQTSIDDSKVSRLVRGKPTTSSDGVNALWKSSAQEISKASLKKACDVYEGCVLGMGSLTTTDASLWKTSKCVDSVGAFCPYTVIVRDKLDGATFGVETFKRTIGSIEDVMSGSYKSMSSVVANADRENSLRSVKLEATMFTPLHILGSGCFGVVVEAELNRIHYDSVEKARRYALKFVSKAKAAVNWRQAINERDFLKECSSPFILHYHGCFQTHDDLVLVVEVLDGPDLFALIKESRCQSRGVPFNMARFFAACVLFGLAHMHERGIAFRDLKPENVMLDSCGYVRIVDLGLASKVPYVAVNPATGESVVNVKLYTLCGTPEYFAPELLLNLGYDQSADLWSYAVMVHEFLVGFTPFCEAREADLRQIFKSIMLVKRRGLHLSTELDSIEFSEESKDFLRKLLKSNPTERLGVQEGATSVVLQHKFFHDLDLEKAFKRDLPAPFIPSAMNTRDRVQSSLMGESLPFTGDQDIFRDF